MFAPGKLNGPAPYPSKAAAVEDLATMKEMRAAEFWLSAACRKNGPQK
jgi:hypothetical protein